MTLLLKNIAPVKVRYLEKNFQSGELLFVFFHINYLLTTFLSPSDVLFEALKCILCFSISTGKNPKKILTTFVGEPEQVKPTKQISLKTSQQHSCPCLTLASSTVVQPMIKVLSNLCFT